MTINKSILQLPQLRQFVFTLGAGAILAGCSTALPALSRTTDSEQATAELGPGEDPTYADLVTFARTRIWSLSLM